MRRLVVGLIALVLLSSSCAGSEAASATNPNTLVSTPDPTPTNVATPTAMPTVAPSGPLLRTERYGPDAAQFGLLQIPADAPPNDGFAVVVFIHGGFWRQGFDFSLMNDLSSDLVTRGYATWNIEYRRVGGSGGWPETGDDVAAAIAHLADLKRDFPLDLDRVVSVGHSAGGHLGLWALGNETAVQVQGSIGLGAVVDLSAFRESQGLLGGTIDEVPEVYADAAPTLDPDRAALIQGEADGIVSTASLEVAARAGVPITVIEGEDHFDLIDPASDSWAATLDQIEAWISHSS